MVSAKTRTANHADSNDASDDGGTLAVFGELLLASIRAHAAYLFLVEAHLVHDAASHRR